MIRSSALLGTVLLAGCGGVPYLDDLADSRRIWEMARDGAGDSYTYDRTYLADGAVSSTTIVVADGVVVERSFDTGYPTEDWTETGAMIGSHDVGSPAVTMDALYDECRDEILPRAGDPSAGDDSLEIETTYGVFEGGLMQNCYATDYSYDQWGPEGIQLRTIGLR